MPELNGRNNLNQLEIGGSSRPYRVQVFKIVIAVFFFYITFKKMFKTHVWNWFSIQKPLIKRYCKINLYVTPKFLLETVTSFQVCINILIKCFVRRNNVRLFSYIKRRLHSLQIKIYQKYKMVICCA